MRLSFFQAKLISLRKLSVLILTNIPKAPETKLYFLKDNDNPILLKINKMTSVGDLYRIECDLPYDYPFGSFTSLHSSNVGDTTIDVTSAIDFPEFSRMFDYHDDDLGITYSKQETTFKLWAPLASDASLKLENEDGTFTMTRMKRGSKGVYSLTVKGDLLNRKYVYWVNNSGVVRETTDPFGFGASLDSTFSAVVDVVSLRKKTPIKPKREIKSYLDAVIYEMHVRDFTESRSANVTNRGKYLGLIESGTKSKQGNPTGLDYLKYLGVTHVQLQPILDFNSRDLADPKKEYNWGYDPISFFAIEGSYSLHPEIPQERLEEFRKVVDTFHKNNIRVNIDVVYNHLFDYLKTSFEKTVPTYFFRKRDNGQMALASGCGNDFASERYMARKAITLSVKHLFETFDIDGLRFDLMGLIDIDTINEVVKIAKNNKKDAMIYGEGWNMGYELPFEKKACSENADKMEQVAFFNDAYRDILKGPTFLDAIRQKGFVNGDFNYAWGFEYAFLGSTVNHVYAPRYQSSIQSLNYVECHDNNALYDKLAMSNPNEDEKTLLERVNLANALVILSNGLPFIHMGQEIGKSKQNLDNTYNIPGVNNLNYDELDKRFDMASSLKNLIALRNNELSILKKISSSKDIAKHFSFLRHENDGVLEINVTPLKDDEFTLIKMFINVTDKSVNYELDDVYNLIYAYGNTLQKKNFKTTNVLVSPRSIEILIKK